MVLLTRLIRINSVINTYQDNDSKHKSYLSKFWLLCNCTKVIDTSAQSPDINPVENWWVHLKKKVEKRPPTNKNELISFIKEDWEKISLEYKNIISRSLFNP